MHCTNCAALVEQRLEQLPQVRRVKVHYRTRRAEVDHVAGLDFADLQSAVADDGFTVSIADGAARPTHATCDYLEIAAAFAILAGLALAAQSFDLIPRGISVSDSVSLGLALFVGLVASVSSCIAVNGGLLVAVAARFNAANTRLSGLERMRPHLNFNAGRLVSYALLGVVGGLGSALMLSPKSDYQPNQFTVKQGVPVHWWIDGSEADGCGRVLLAPQLGIEKLLSATSTTLITFIPDQHADYAFNCGMGMMTPGSKITVLPRDKG